MGALTEAELRGAVAQPPGVPWRRSSHLSHHLLLPRLRGSQQARGAAKVAAQHDAERRAEGHGEAGRP